MDQGTAKKALTRILADIVDGRGAAVDRFASLRDVDAKVREFKMVLGTMDGLPTKMLGEMERDEDFVANSRRVRLEALANYCRMVLGFLDTGAIKPEKTIVSPPRIARLTSALPDLDRVIEHRWLEAQVCQHAGAFLSAVIMMGSILEALLLARALKDRETSFRSSRSPKTKDGKNIPIQEWNLNQLIEVAVEVGWIKTDRGKFGHALRESRNVVHPWVHVTLRADFDEATCKTCWHVLNASVEDLLSSVR